MFEHSHNQRARAGARCRGTAPSVAIQVHGDFAFADYYFTLVSKDADRKAHHSKGRWTDILTKRGDRWVRIGYHGGEMKDD